SPRRPHAVADTAHVEYEIRAKLAPQPMDVNLHRIALDFLAPTVESLLDLRPGVDGARTLQQQLQQGELLGGQVDLAAVTYDCVGRRSELHAKVLDPRLGPPRLAAQQGTNPGCQLVQIERLDQIVVRTGIQSLNAVRDGIARSNDENGQILAARPERLQD